MKDKTKTNTACKPKLYLHGEAMIFESKLPDDAEPLAVDGPFLIIADSETTGNHHVVDKKAHVKFFKSKDGTRRFMQALKPTQVRCLQENRHDTITLDPGVYEFGVQKEYDPFTENLRNVRD